MGNSSSAALDVALQSPSGPMRALAPSWITQGPTSVHIKMALSGLSATVTTDAASTNVVYTLSSKVLSSRAFLKGPTGEILATLKKSTFSSTIHVFQGDQTDHEQFTIYDTGGLFKTMLFVAKFHDLKTGAHCRVVAEGRAGKRVSLCYLERGSSKLSKLQNSDDFAANKGNYQPVGRISRNPKLISSPSRHLLELT